MIRKYKNENDMVNKKSSRSKEGASYRKNDKSKQQNNSSKVAQIPNLESYAAIDKLKLGKVALEKIKSALEIEKLAETQFEERIKQENYYVNFKKNPFNNQSDIKTNPYQKKINQQNINIIDSLLLLKEKSQHKNMMNRLSRQESNANYLHKQIKDNETRQQKRRKTSLYLNDEIEQKENMDFSARASNPYQDFDNIIKMGQQNFYHKVNSKKSHNIFQIARNQNSDILLSYSSLKRLHFCEDSTILKPNSIKLSNIFRDLSYISRMFIGGRYNSVAKEYKILPSDIKAILDQIHFRDIMMISSGVIYPEILEAYLEQGKAEKKDDQSKSLTEIQKETLYEDNQYNKHTLLEVDQHDKGEIQSYINHSLSKMEIKQKRLSEMHKQKMIEYIRQEQHCTATNINDKVLRTGIKSKKSDALVKQYDDQIRRQHGSIDRIVRMNKLHKDKVEKIKIAGVIETIRIQKQHQNRIRSKSKKTHHQSLADWR